MRLSASVIRRLGFFLCLASSHAAFGGNGVVTTPCNEASFNNVLSNVINSGGGTLTFACGAAPTTITFSSAPYRMISNNVSVIVDGGSLVTLDGNTTVAFFQISTGAALTLRNITLRHGVVNNVHALENFGTLTLDHATLTANTSSDSVILNSGTLSVQSSTLSNNTISSANASAGAAIKNSSGTVTISASTFVMNTIPGNFGSGGAIDTEGGTLSIATTTFTQNSAYNGGVIVASADAVVRIQSSTFNNNSGGYGGAIYNNGAQVTIRTTTLSNNSSISGEGGAIWNAVGTLATNGVQFTHNQSADTGGAIACDFGTSPVSSMTLNNSSFSNNTSTSHGGAVYADCTTNASDDTFTGNTATSPGEGGAISQGGNTPQVTVAFSTIVGNTAVAGAGIVGTSGTHDLLIGTSIVSANPGGNCAGSISSFGYNVSDDNDCGGVFTGTGDLLSANVPMQAYGNYGGATLALPPASGNAAIDHVPLALCNPKLDQRGASRPAGALCDSGAVELNAIFDDIFTDGFDSF